MDRTLNPEMLDSSPTKQFALWFDEVVAAGLPEPNAMVLTTSGTGEGPHARTVLLKAHSDEGFTFYTNRTSRKGRDLAADPRCCALFPWYGIGRQVTVEGVTRQLSTEESEPYFHSRPWLSQISAWASRQSSVLASRAELDGRARLSRYVKENVNEGSLTSRRLLKQQDIAQVAQVLTMQRCAWLAGIHINSRLPQVVR